MLSSPFFFPLFSRRSKIDPHFVALYSGQPLARKRTSFRRAFQKHFGTLQGASTPCAVTHRYDDDLFTPVLDGEIVENGIWDQESGPTLGPKCLEYSIPSPIFFFLEWVLMIGSAITTAACMHENGEI